MSTNQDACYYTLPVSSQDCARVHTPVQGDNGESVCIAHYSRKIGQSGHSEHEVFVERRALQRCDR